MRLFLKLLFLTIILSPLAAGALLFLAIETHPRTVDRKSDITPASIERAKRILNQNDPRRLKSGERRTVSTSAADLDLAANYLAQQFGRGSARVKLQSDTAEASASIRVPAIPLPLFFNIDLSMSEQPPLARLQSLRIGRIPVPPFLARWLALRLLTFEYPDLNIDALTNAIKKIEFSETTVALTYEWQEGLVKQLRMLVLSPDEQERVNAYHARLVEVSRALPQKNLSMVELLSELLKLTVERSAGTSAAAETRAALLVLTFYVNGRSLETIIPEAKNWPHPAKHRIVLNQRDDFPKHFIISAAIAANAGEPLADAVGLYKEVEDSRGGSGFSFNDIAADRAGSKFGEYARSANGSILQKKLREGIKERDLMPSTADLPEFMPEAEFQRRFGGIDGAEYKKMMAEIERRIAALPFYR
jgi:hypothetical protein